MKDYRKHDRQRSTGVFEAHADVHGADVNRPRWQLDVQHCDYSDSDDDIGHIKDSLYRRELPFVHDTAMATWVGQPAIKGSSETMRMMLLTCASIGIAFTWGVEMTYCTPYMLSLGLTKGQASFVWLAGPISGMIVQPVVGVISDQWTGKWGRRRPFIVVGNILVVGALLTLGFTSEIVTAVLGNEGFTLGQGTTAPIPHRKIVITLAVLALYVVDFAINAAMSCVRSLVVDTLPIEKQQEGSAWSSRMASFGHLIGYGAGAVDLVAALGPTLGDTQFKQLTVIAAASIVCTSAVTCWAVTERAMLPSHGHSHDMSDMGGLSRLIKVFRQIWSTLLTLPPRMQAICWAVFWGWIGWFPFMIYSSTWVGETYFRYDVPTDARVTNDALGDMGRIGSYALTAYSSVTVLAAAVLPLLVRSPFDENFTHRPPKSIARFADFMEKSRPDLLNAWTCGHIVFAFVMFMTPFAMSFRVATLLVSLCGIPWTVVTWAPAAFLGIEVNRLTNSRGGASHRRLRDSGDLGKLEHGLSKAKSTETSSGELSGIYFGILNMYTTVPQFLGNMISTMVFAVLEPGKSPELAKDAHPSEHHSTDGPNAIAVIFFIGAFFALISARATRRLKVE
ncbi:sucrose transport protein [Grosmannia clavigera kw1407]|uniref:Sucrose transport protein n=1 Tax=Grosmannia clavigera (strain kw1407 / UAMH 11150) TaxID=655863 RepID=F0XLI8_GROCL|nr:sucrose transport protein [Grosmannia clavigera kw1407]EFX01167.1 sucrose transport protein [Grosmannia clavigera kw1407]